MASPYSISMARYRRKPSHLEIKSSLDFVLGITDTDPDLALKYRKMDLDKRLKNARGTIAQRGPMPEFTEEEGLELLYEIEDYLNSEPGAITIETWIANAAQDYPNMSTQKIRSLSQRYPSCKEQYDRIKDIQVSKTFEKVLGNELNTNFAIFYLKNRGYNDKQEIEHTGNGGINISVNVVEDDDTIVDGADIE